MKIIILAVLCILTLSTAVQAPRKLFPVASCYMTLQNGKCAECIFGFAIVNETCQPTTNHNCKTFDPLRGVCSSCFVGYQLQTDSSCAYNPAVNVFQHCSFLLFGTLCIACDPGYYFNPDNNCQAIDPNCAVFKYQASNSFCSKCKTGYVYYQSRGQCIPTNSPPDPGCATWLGDICFKCISGWTLYDFACVLANPNCRLRRSAFPFSCSACYPGYILNTGDCVPEAVNNPLCAAFNSNGTCKKCAFRSIKNVLGICINVNPLCNTFNSKTGKCVSCYGGYVLNSGNCVIATDANCLVWTGSKCTQCIPWTYYDGSKCVQVDTNCKSFDSSNGDCTSCYGGWTLTGGSCSVNSDPECRVVESDGTCSACYGGYYYNLNDGQCEIGNPLCNGMDLYGNCLDCYPSYYLKNGNCLTIDPTCATFNKDAGQCSSCYQGYALSNGKCT